MAGYILSKPLFHFHFQRLIFFIFGIRPTPTLFFHVISNNHTSLPLHTTFFESTFHKGTTLRAQTTLFNLKKQTCSFIFILQCFCFSLFYFQVLDILLLWIHRRCEGALISCSNKCCFEKEIEFEVIWVFGERR